MHENNGYFGNVNCFWTYFLVELCLNCSSWDKVSNKMDKNLLMLSGNFNLNILDNNTTDLILFLLCLWVSKNKTAKFDIGIPMPKDLWHLQKFLQAIWCSLKLEGTLGIIFWMNAIWMHNWVQTFTVLYYFQ